MRKQKTHNLVALFILAGLSLGATPKAVQISTDFKLAAPRWGNTPAQPKKGLVKSLYEAKQHEVAGQYKKCFEVLAKISKPMQGLEPWLAFKKLKCGSQVIRSDAGFALSLEAVIKEVETNSSWLEVGTHTKSLRHEFLASYVALLDKQADLSRQKAWGTVDKILRWKMWLSVDQLAEVYRIAGEMAFVQQDYLLAQDFILRSLNERQSSKLQERLDSIRSNFALPSQSQGSAPVTGVRSQPGIEVSEKEKQIYRRYRNNLEAGDLVAAVEDGIELITEFPGGVRADEAAEKILSIYYGVVRKSDRKYVLLKNRITKLLKKADGERLLWWARILYSRGAYEEAQTLATLAYEKLKGVEMATEAGLLGGLAAVSSGDYDAAEGHFREVANHHAGTKEAREAVYRLGLLFVRTEKFGKASAFFERYLATPSADHYELQAMYWLWRSQQKLGNHEVAKEQAKRLWERFPVTYYGLRARAESNGGQLSWEKPKDGRQHLAVRFWFTKEERLAWQRYQTLVEAGWYAEAQQELKAMPAPKSPEELLVHANLYALAFDHYQASILAHQAWDSSPALLQKELLRIIYPLEFDKAVTAQAQRYGVDPDVIRSLIKQESSFRTDAVSPAGAMGLMQLMPPTAREVGRYLKKGTLQLPEDMFDPDLNIKFGTNYISRMLRAFDGHLPLALAAYNVGIGNMRKWLGSRPDLRNKQGVRNSAPENEIWIDELPWAETSFYVKAILRNYLVYKVLSTESVELKDPIWQVSKLDQSAGQK